VDDQPLFRSATRAVVECTPGFEFVGESADGRSALTLVLEADADLVIIDMRMPGMDGIEVAQRLAADDPSRVLVLASSADPRDFGAASRTCGASALLRKQWLTPRTLRGLWVAHRRR
jgi:DNA-binding NarL/FixJ family response regulator